MPHLSALSLALNRPGAVSLEQVVASLFASGEQGAWYDPSAANVTWRRNLLTRTEEFDNAAWLLDGAGTTRTANQAVAPDATTTADRIVFTAASRGVYQDITIGNGAFTGSYYVKAGQVSEEGKTIAIGVGNATDGFTDVLITLTSDWQRITATRTTNAGTTCRCAIHTYAGATARDVLVWGAQLERGTTPTAYQRIVTPELTYLADVQAQPLLWQTNSGIDSGTGLLLPVWNVEQPVGLIMDKRLGAAYGPEIITNAADREFSSNTGYWTLGANATIGSGVLSISGAATNTTQLQRASVFSSGKTYIIRATIKNYSAGAVRLGFNDQFFQLPSANGTYYVFLNSGIWGATSFVVRVVGTTTLDLDDISIKELLGNHAVQTSSAARPVLRARYNLLTYSEQFNTTWGLVAMDAFGSGSTANAITAPDGTTTADLLKANGTSSPHGLTQLSVAASGYQKTFSLYAKEGTHGIIQMLMDGNTNGWANFDLAAGTSHAQGTGVAVSITKDATTGWCRCVMTDTDGTATGLRIALVTATSASRYQSNTLSTAVYLWGADLRVGTSAGDYQRIAASTDYATVSTITGQAFRPYLNFDAADGTADSLFTASVDFSATDKMFFAASVQKANDTSIGTICELSATTNTNNGAFVVFASENSAPNYAFGLRGTDYGYYRATTYTAPITNVLSCVYDIAGSTSADEIKPQVNKAIPSLSFQNNVAGTGNFGNYPLYIGRRSNNSVPFTGRVFGMLIRGAATTASQVSAAEDYMAGKAGLTL